MCAWDKTLPKGTDKIKDSDDEIRANWAAIEAVLGNLVINGEAIPEELKNLTTAEIQQLENIGATTISAAQWGYLGALTTHPIGGDGTAGRILRLSYLEIDDGTNANTLKCKLSNRWNGDTTAETDNIAKGATTGDFSLSADGETLTIKASGLTGNALGTLVNLYDNRTNVYLAAVGWAIYNNINILARESKTGVKQDFTVLVDTGKMYLKILYITDV